MKNDTIISCAFCSLVIGREKAKEILSPEGNIYLCCGKCTRESTVSRDIAHLFRGPDYLFCKETYVVERLSDITSSVSIRLYCEGYQCAYDLAYDTKWRDNETYYFVQEHIAENTRYIRTVANCIVFGTDEEDTPMKKIWNTLESEEIHEGDLLKRQGQPRNAYVKNGFDFELFACPIDLEGEEEEGMFYAAVNYSLFYPYCRYSEFLQFQFVGSEEDENTFYIRILDQEKMIAFLPVEEVFTLTKKEYQEWMNDCGYIYYRENEE